MDPIIFESICEELDKNLSLEPGLIDFSHLGYTSIPFSGSNFHSIPSSDPDPVSKITFIDGGVAELFSSSSVSLSFVRVIHTTYRKNRRTNLKKDEFFCLTTTKSSPSINFHSQLFPSSSTTLPDSFFETDFTFDPTDSALTTRQSRASISSIPNIIRRLAELSATLILTKQSRPNDSIVLDGSLEPKLPDEEKLLRSIASLAKENNINIAGLCKTTNLLTSSGSSPMLALSDKALEGAWFYFPVIEAPFDLYFLKLHPGSDYIFRLDHLPSQSTATLLYQLKNNSSDPVFLGYPYGLVEADRFARVTNNEKEYLKTTFLTRAGSRSKSLNLLARSLDAHSVLDNIG